MFDLGRFRLSELIECGSVLRTLGDGSSSLEEAAQRIVGYLRDGMGDGHGNRACPLVRLYKTHPYGDLDGELRASAAAMLPGSAPRATTPCLVLLATAGERAEWNDRRRSAGHRAIPLPSQEVVARMPMISQLIDQFGLDAQALIDPTPSLLLDLDQRTYNVFHVAEALGSPHVPAQADFVVPMGIRSVVGFGGMLPSGDLFAVILFSRVPVTRETARRFTGLALSVKAAALPFLDGRIFRDAIHPPRLSGVRPTLNGLSRLRSQNATMEQLLQVHEHAVLEQARELEVAVENLTRTHSLLNATLESTADGIMVADNDGSISGFNRKFIEMWRIPQDVIDARDDGRAIAAVLEQLTDPEGFLSKVRELYAQPDAESHDVLHFKDGRIFERYSQPQRIGGVSVGRVWSFRDASERAAQQEALEHQALHDALTGLPNRVLFADRLGHSLVQAARERRSVALLVMDLDRFKDVNDTLGHGHGDALLQSIADRLRTAVRGADTVARLGGDEFAILPAGDVDADGAAQVARTLLKALEAPFTVNGQAVDARASIGIALYPDHGVDAGELMRRADVAMYVAKRTRSGQALYAPHQDERSMGRLAMLGELRHAIVHEELELHYQPKLDLRSNRVCGVEALIRWRHPSRGLVHPAGFMPLVEESELMAPLTWWLLNDALGQVRAWRDAGLDLGMAVNLSPRNLQDPHLGQSIGELLRLWEVPADRLTLELTENVVMAAGATEMLRPLQEMGVRLSIDDFGTGYSSLAYLKRLPVAELKIDRSFVTELASDADDAAIVGPTIALGHNLGLEVVAEGVEDGPSLRMLGEHGCDVVQGFFICRPLPAAELTDWLRQSPWLRGTPWCATPAVAVRAHG